MKAATRRYGGLVVTVILLPGLLGCFPPRSEIYSELNRSRLSAYTRWQRETGEEEKLPRMQGNLSAEDAMKVALTYSPALAAVLEEKEKARGEVLRAYGEALPSVDFDADYTRYDEVSILGSPSGSYA